MTVTTTGIIDVSHWESVHMIDLESIIPVAKDLFVALRAKLGDRFEGSAGLEAIEAEFAQYQREPLPAFDSMLLSAFVESMRIEARKRFRPGEFYKFRIVDGQPIDIVNADTKRPYEAPRVVEDLVMENESLTCATARKQDIGSCILPPFKS